MRVYAAGGLCLLLGAGHTLVGHLWILRRLRSQPLPATPFGAPSATGVALAVTWDMVTIAVIGLGLLLIGLADHQASAERTLVLQTVAAIFASGTAMTVWLGRRRLRSLARRPVLICFVAVAALCATSA